MTKSLEVECQHGLTAQWCAWCNGAAKREFAPPVVTTWIDARFPGQCTDCRSRFEVGTRIGYAPEVGGWVGPCCSPPEVSR